VFGEFHGLPVHALIVHAVVVLVPLSALLGVLFAIPRTRQWSRHAYALVSLGALGATFAARQSGVHLMQNLDVRQASPPTNLLSTHQNRGNWLFYMMIGFAVVAVAAWLLSRDPARYSGVLAAVVSAVVVAASVAIGVQVYRVGEIGSKMVWNPTGDVDYNNT
jgi:uncharacterized membrane protein